VEWRWCWCLCRCSDRVGGREAGLEGEVAREEMAHVKKARSSNLVGASRRLEQGEQCASSSQEIQQMTREGAGDALEAGAGRSDGGGGEGATLRRFVEMGTLACHGHVHVAQTHASLPLPLPRPPPTTLNRTICLTDASRSRDECRGPALSCLHQPWRKTRVLRSTGFATTSREPRSCTTARSTATRPTQRRVWPRQFKSCGVAYRNSRLH
jgi:hypothetical protein